jgi:hypothetical protein
MPGFVNGAERGCKAILYKATVRLSPEFTRSLSKGRWRASKFFILFDVMLNPETSSGHAGFSTFLYYQFFSVLSIHQFLKRVKTRLAKTMGYNYLGPSL